MSKVLKEEVRCRRDYLWVWFAARDERRKVIQEKSAFIFEPSSHIDDTTETSQFGMTNYSDASYCSCGCLCACALLPSSAVRSRVSLENQNVQRSGWAVHIPLPNSTLGSRRPAVAASFTRCVLAVRWLLPTSWLFCTVTFIPCTKMQRGDLP